MLEIFTIKRGRSQAPLDPRLPKLGRSVYHDSRSRQFAYSTVDLTLVSTKHERYIPVLDQGDLGSCTGNAGIGLLGTGLFFSDRGTHYTLDEDGAVHLYSDATRLDTYAGTYPPIDTGSDGLSVAKALTKAGEVAGYRHTFTLQDALLAVTQQPVITGINWYEAMFSPDADGRVHPTGQLAGGHEIVIDQIVVETEQVWCTNSWGTSWGVQGRFYLSFDDFGRLLSEDGDVTVPTPKTQPPPTPVPPSPPAPPPPVPPAPPTPDPVDVELAAAQRKWLAAKGL